MKEVTRNDALVGTWKEMSAQKRLRLLKRLDTNKASFNERTDILLASKQDDWWKLPIPLRTFLGSCFDNGKFGKIAKRQRSKYFKNLVKSIVESIDEFG